MEENKIYTALVGNNVDTAIYDHFSECMPGFIAKMQASDSKELNLSSEELEALKHILLEGKSNYKVSRLRDAPKGMGLENMLVFTAAEHIYVVAQPKVKVTIDNINDIKSGLIIRKGILNRVFGTFTKEAVLVYATNEAWYSPHNSLLVYRIARNNGAGFKRTGHKPPQKYVSRYEAQQAREAREGK